MDEVNRGSEWVTQTKKKMKRQRAPKPAKMSDDMTQWSQAWGTGPTETNRLRGKEKSCTPPRWKSRATPAFNFHQIEILSGTMGAFVRQRASANENEKHNKKENENQDDICHICMYECVSVYMFPIIESRFHKHMKTMVDFQLLLRWGNLDGMIYDQKTEGCHTSCHFIHALTKKEETSSWTLKHRRVQAS